MNPPSREKEIFEQALEQPSAEARLGYVKEACGGDAGLLARVETLLRAHEATSNFLPETPGGLTFHHAMAEMAEQPGAVIGRYKLLERIGEGGFGTVYMAEQSEPVRRRVALKVIKLGMDTKEVVARFEAERQALAMMDHPNIAKVLDGGATDTGRPYFVMELVKGVPITTYCDQRQLSTPARLELFILVCQAVQHAHQKGIIHRDLKPSNILVTEQDDRPVPKIIDFGVARATQARLTEKTMFTQFHQLVGTPAYMSPEQTGLANLDIDTRSDIYSLGVLLYELLTGQTPFDAKKLLEAGYEGIMRIIREVEPPKPSTRLSSLSLQELTALGGRRQEEPRRLGRLVQGDLDWIVMKALEKDRARRYETASNLAQDLQRHLSNEPVTARPPSTAYVLQKLFRRHRIVFGGVLIIVAVWIAGTAISTYLAIRAVRAEKEAEAEADTVRYVHDFLGTIFGQASERHQLAEGFPPVPDITLRQALDRATRKLLVDDGYSYLRDTRNRGDIALLLGQIYLWLGEDQTAIAHLEKAVALRANAFGTDHRQTMDYREILATAYQRAGRLADAIALREKILRWEQAEYDPPQPWPFGQTRTRLGFTYLAAGQKEKGLAQIETALREIQAALASDAIEIVEAIGTLADAHRQAGQPAEAIALYEKALALAKARPAGLSHPAIFDLMVRLVRAYRENGRTSEAVMLSQEALPVWQAQQARPPEGSDTLGAMRQYALSYRAADRTAEAVALGRHAFELSRNLQGETHPEVVGWERELRTFDPTLVNQTSH